MKLKLHTQAHFDAAHYLRGYEGNCRNVHGHRWEVKLQITGVKLDKCGMLWDFKNLKQVLQKYDHQLLNDLVEFKILNPTAENITKTILEELKNKNPGLEFSIRVYESPESYCEATK